MGLLALDDVKSVLCRTIDPDTYISLILFVLNDEKTLTYQPQVNKPQIHENYH